MNNNYIHPSRTELFLIFSITEAEAAQMKIRYLKTKIQEHEEKYNKMLCHRLRAKENQLWIIDDFLKEQRAQIDKHTRAIGFLKRRNQALKQVPGKARPQVVYYDKEEAKQKTCREVLHEHGINVTPRGQFKIRDERTPSCSLYKNDTRWKDFGSGEGGDVIDLYMKINDCDFKTAVKELHV